MSATTARGDMNETMTLPYAAPAKAVRAKRKPRGKQSQWKLPLIRQGEKEVRCTYADGVLTFREKHKRKVTRLTLADAWMLSTGQALLELEKSK